MNINTFVTRFFKDDSAVYSICLKCIESEDIKSLRNNKSYNEMFLNFFKNYFNNRLYNKIELSLRMDVMLSDFFTLLGEDPSVLGLINYSLNEVSKYRLSRIGISEIISGYQHEKK